MPSGHLDSVTMETRSKYAFFSLAAGAVAIASAYEKAAFAPEVMLHHLSSSRWSVLVLVNLYLLLLVRLFQIIVASSFQPLAPAEIKHIRESAFHFVLLRCILLSNTVNLAWDIKLLKLTVWISMLTLLQSLLTTLRSRLDHMGHTSVAAFQSFLGGLLLGIGLLSSASYYVLDFAKLVSFVSLSECALLLLDWIQLALQLYLEAEDVDSDGIDDLAVESKTSFGAQAQILLEVLCLATKAIQFIVVRTREEIPRLSFVDFAVVMHARQTCTSVTRQYHAWRHYQLVRDALNHTFVTVRDLPDRCVVCLHNLDIAKKLPCGHAFHRRCLRQCLQETSKSSQDEQNGTAKCAVCRQEIVLKAWTAKEESQDEQCLLWPLCPRGL
ncbi:hypothetical protein AC1031_007807 [Aphanomyces cochlioides]|nr:hypothetical protein AC1031_007807 [Aphanomyces cochlioides]